MKPASERLLLVLLASVQFTQPRDRGAYMSLNGCVRDLAGGLSSAIGGWMVTRADDGSLNHFGRLGWMAVAAGLLTLWLVRRVRMVEV